MPFITGRQRFILYSAMTIAASMRPIKGFFDLTDEPTGLNAILLAIRRRHSANPILPHFWLLRKSQTVG